MKNVPSRSMALLPFQLLVVILTLGPAMFLGILLVFHLGPKHDVPFFGSVLTHTGIVMACVSTIINSVLLVVLRRWASRSSADSPANWLGIYSVVGAFFFSSAAFTSLAALAIDQSMAAFILAIVLIVAAASRFPTVGIVRRWMRSE